ncbi:MAG: SIMPL domain-containing protein [Phycisphaerales bacterium]|nr:SIMPL domain-containing protein [Phycisphaerales bacterium]
MIRASAIAAALLSAWTVAASAAPTLTVNGHARLEVPADQFSLSLGASASAPTVEAARSEVDGIMRQLEGVVATAGLTEHTEWHTGRYDVRPQWKPRPRNTDAATWTPEILGYTVRSNISITSDKMSVAGTLVAEAAKAGANDIGSLSFSLKDPRTSRREAIQQAARHAIDDAATLAAASQVTLVRVLQLSLDGAQTTPPRPVEAMYAGTAMARAMSDNSAPTLSGGMVTVTASVTAEWEIAPTVGAQPEQTGTAG